MKIVGVIQARSSSRRLPGKVLRALCGKPMLEWLVESARHAAGLSGIVIATSEDSSDDALAQFALASGASCFRGPLDNVARRMWTAGQAHGADAIVRLNGDSPLMDPRLIDAAIRLFEAGGVDLATNVLPRSFPKGQSVEVVSVRALRDAEPHMGQTEREHVTQYLYANSGRFSIRAFQAAQPRPEVQLSIDEQADFERCEAILRSLGVPPWQAGWQACVDAYDAVHSRAPAGAP